jgi:hypothetical protein
VAARLGDQIYNDKLLPTDARAGDGQIHWPTLYNPLGCTPAAGPIRGSRRRFVQLPEEHVMSGQCSAITRPVIISHRILFDINKLERHFGNTQRTS